MKVNTFSPNHRAIERDPGLITHQHHPVPDAMDGTSGSSIPFFFFNEIRVNIKALIVRLFN